MQITVNETDIKTDGSKFSIHINSDLEKALGLNKVVLSSVKPGTVINNGFIVLEHYENGTTAMIRKDLMEDIIKFGEDNNNWCESNIRKYLNGVYRKKLEDEFGKENIVEHTTDLLSMDGLNDYGRSRDKVSLLTIDQYRKYRKVLGKNMEDWWWLATPGSTTSGWSSSCVQYVCDDGRVVCCGYCYWGSMRPFFVLKSSVFVFSATKQKDTDR
ncbi:MAG: hypothetical protein K2M46_04280 [Lachnospiraceae bacterium]|nr:hypothetical protein [Lachnospiraceae bacterium]